MMHPLPQHIGRYQHHAACGNVKTLRVFRRIKTDARIRWNHAVFVDHRLANVTVAADFYLGKYHRVLYI